MCTNSNLKSWLIISVFLVMIKCVATSGSEKASDPAPTDGAFLEATWAQLRWSPGDNASDHDVYFSDDCGEVYADAGAGPAFQGRQKETSFVVGFFGYPYPDGLVWGTTYYWRVDEFDGVVTHRGDVWKFTVGTAPSVAPRTLFVDIDATGANNGSNWTNAFNLLQDALTEAQYGTEIWVAEGTYTPDQGVGQTPGDRKSTFQLKADLSIYGGFKGDETSLDQRDWALHETILSGDLNGDDEEGLISDNVYHVVTGSGTCRSAVLDGFTIMHGNATWPEDNVPHKWDGGGMLNEGGSPTIGNCRFVRNSAGNGGGMYNFEQSSPKVHNCTFLRNDADVGGGMLNQDSSNPDITLCTFTENRAERPIGNGGGGLYNYRSSPKVVGCTFLDNRAKEGGGMTNLSDSNPDINDCTFIGNWANVRGGCMYNRESSPKIFNCIFLQNSSDCTCGGIYYWEQSNAKLINCTFRENSAGAVVIFGAYAEVVNCAFIQNSNSAEPSYGGAVDTYDSDSVLINCTFVGNSADIGGAIRNCHLGYYGSKKHMTLTNCILWDNTAGTGPQIALQGYAELSIDFCDLQGSWWGLHADPDCTVEWGNGMIAANPLFKDGDGRLSTGSPCIDAGNNISVPAGIHVDLDGMQRFVDDPLTVDTGAGTPPFVDMGAYEFDPSSADDPFCSQEGSSEIFTADFEGDQIGSPPAPTTPGRYGPAGASLRTFGTLINREVVNSAALGSKALKIARDREEGTTVYAIVGDDGSAPHTTGVYYIDYMAHGQVVPVQIVGGLLISVRSVSNKSALILRLYDGAYYLWEDFTYTALAGSYDPSEAHRVHIELDLDTRTYSICINNEVVISQKPLLAEDFDDLHRLQFFAPRMASESDTVESVYVVDDIRITK